MCQNTARPPYNQSSSVVIYITQLLRHLEYRVDWRLSEYTISSNWFGLICTNESDANMVNADIKYIFNMHTTFRLDFNLCWWMRRLIMTQLDRVGAGQLETPLEDRLLAAVFVTRNGWTDNDTLRCACARCAILRRIIKYCTRNILCS